MNKWTCPICHENMYSADAQRSLEYVQCLICEQFFKNPYFDGKPAEAEPTLTISWFKDSHLKTKTFKDITIEEAVGLIWQAICDHDNVQITWEYI